MGIQIKKFKAESLQKAIEEVRSELGDDAIILQTETIKEKGAFGLMPRALIEVTAAIERRDVASDTKAMTNTTAPTTVPDVSKTPVEKKPWLTRLGLLSVASDETKPKTPAARRKTEEAESWISSSATPSVSSGLTDTSKTRSNVQQLYAIKTFVEPLQKEIESLRSKVEASERNKAEKTSLLLTSNGVRKKVFDPLESEIHKLRNDLHFLMAEKRFAELELAPVYRKLYLYWISRGLTEVQVLAFFKNLEAQGINLEEVKGSDECILSALKSSIRQADVLSQPKERIVVLVGATGVGKTTTIAKLAAHEKLRLRRSVCVVSVDDYKIGAVDQLSHYARLLQVPFLKTRNDMSLEDQLTTQHADTIFIDTFGISPSDSERLEKLVKMLDFQDADLAKKVEVHLVVPAGVSGLDVHNLWESYKVLRPSYLIFTKWDETQSWGGMLATIMESQKPVSFLCHGQNVPDDMSLFSQESFISAVTDFNSSF